jgi:hypothetical protein
MARPRVLVRPREWKVSVPIDLAAAIEEQLYDPALGKPSYGKRSELICNLLRKWLETQHGDQHGTNNLIPAA